MTSAIYFDGLSARAHRVDLDPADGMLALVGGDIVKQVPHAQVQVMEPFEHAPCILNIADGSRCEVSEPDAKRAILTALGYRDSRVERWQRRWYGALLALMAMLVGGFAAYQWGLPALAERIVASTPMAVEQRLGEQALLALDRNQFQPTRLSEQRLQQVQDVFRSIVPAQTRMPVQVLVRDAPTMGPNAFALPNGTIVVTDAMVSMIAGHDDLKGASADQLAAVLAHEIGHVQGRHTMRQLARSSLMLAGSWALFGDFSAVAAGAPALLTGLNYSRQMELEADDYAAALLKREGFAPESLAEVFELMQNDKPNRAEAGLPEWMRGSMGYLSSHPSNAARIERLRRATRH